MMAGVPVVLKNQGDGKDDEKKTVMLSFEGVKLSVPDFVKEWNARVERRKKLAESNGNVLYDDFEKLVKGKRLDSNIKKCTAFVRKMRTINESVKVGLENDVRTLNLSKYVSEIALVVVESKLKSADIPPLISVCSEIHKRYREFSPQLLENFTRVLALSVSTLSGHIRLFLELIVCGILPQAKSSDLLLQTLQRLVTLDKHGGHLMPMLVNLLRDMTDELIEGLPRDVRLHLETSTSVSELRRSQDIGIASVFKAKIRGVLKKYFLLVKSIQAKKNDKVWGSAKYLRKLLESKGEFPPEREKVHDDLVAELEKYHSQVERLANLIDVQAPKLYYLSKNPDEDFDQALGALVEDSGGMGPLFEDEETREFYLELPDLKAYLFEKKTCAANAIARGKDLSAQVRSHEKEGDSGDASDDSFDSDESSSSIDIEGLDSGSEESINLDDFDAEALKNELMQLNDEPPSDPSADSMSMGEGCTDDEETLSKESSPEKVPKIVAEAPETRSKMPFQSYLKHLKTCVNKNMIDKAATDFVANYRNKRYRTEVAKFLFTIARQRMDLTRLFSRLIANLSQVYPEIGHEVCELVRQELKFLILKRDQQRLEPKLRMVRLLGELVIFSILSKNDAFNSMKMLLRNFTHHQIEMMCCLLDICGKFLYRSRESHRRMKLYLEEMIRRKNTQFMEARHSYQVECAFSQVCSTGTEQSVKRKKTPVQVLIEYVLRYDLNRNTVKRACEVLSMFSWEDPLKTEMVIGILGSPWRLNYSQLDPAAAVLAFVQKIRPTVALAVIENVSEFVRLGCEFESEDMNNMRMSTCQYLSFLFNYKCISTTTLLNVMYYLISFGVTYQNHTFTRMDPPDSVQRVRIICHMLRIVCDYFTSPKANKRLDFFLKYFQRYYLYKKELPIWEVDGWQRFPHYVTETFEDTMKRVRSNWVFASTLGDAEDKIISLDKELRATTAKTQVIQKAIRGNHVRSKVTVRKPSEKKKSKEGKLLAVVAETSEQSDGEDDFEKEFRNLCAEGGDSCSSSYSVSSSHSRKKDIPSAKMLRVAKSGIDELTGGSSRVKVTVLTKQNNKPQEKTLELETKEDFLVSIKQREEREKKDKLEVKSRILQLSRRQEEEEQEAKNRRMIKALQKLGTVAFTPGSPKRGINSCGGNSKN